MELSNKKTYLIRHSRKGTFALKIESQCDTWVHGTIAGGKAKAMMEYNECSKGDPVSCRRSHIVSAVEQQNI